MATKSYLIDTCNIMNRPKTLENNPMNSLNFDKKNSLSLEMKDLIKSVGSEIKNHKGEILGKIDDIKIDEERKIPEYLILCCEDLFGDGNRYFAIPVQPLLINFDKDNDIIIPVEKDSLKIATGISVDSWPKFDPEISDSIFELLRYENSLGKKRDKEENDLLKTP